MGRQSIGNTSGRFTLVIGGATGPRSEDVGRVLCEHPLPSQARPAAAEWTAARSGATPPRFIRRGEGPPMSSKKN